MRNYPVAANGAEANRDVGNTITNGGISALINTGVHAAMLTGTKTTKATLIKLLKLARLAS